MLLAEAVVRVTVLDRLVAAGPLEPLVLLRLQMAAEEGEKELQTVAELEPEGMGVMEARGAEALEAEAVFELLVLLAEHGVDKEEVESLKTIITDVGMVDQEILLGWEKVIVRDTLAELVLAGRYG